MEALRAIQAKRIDYGEFVRRVMTVGTVGCDVFLEGRKAVYTGRKGELYVESFPGSK